MGSKNKWAAIASFVPDFEHSSKAFDKLSLYSQHADDPQGEFGLQPAVAVGSREAVDSNVGSNADPNKLGFCDTFMFPGLLGPRVLVKVF